MKKFFTRRTSKTRKSEVENNEVGEDETGKGNGKVKEIKKKKSGRLRQKKKKGVRENGSKLAGMRTRFWYFVVPIVGLIVLVTALSVVEGLWVWFWWMVL